LRIIYALRCEAGLNATISWRVAAIGRGDDLIQVMDELADGYGGLEP